MTEDAAALRAEIARLEKIVRVLMDRAERGTNLQGSDFSLFQTAVMLEEQVQARTAELEQAHVRLLQSEKLASVGQLAAGVAHEINNPIGFIHSNLGTLKNYLDDLFALLDRHIAAEPDLPAATGQRLAEARRAADLDFLREDVAALIGESAEGAARVQRIVQGLRAFARPDEAAWQATDLHAGLESVLSVAAGEIAPRAEVRREYGRLPLVECLPAQINQVFLNILLNAAQAIPRQGTITLRTAQDGDFVSITIGDTGTGMPPEVAKRIFDPFFTTRPVGQGAGLGLSMAYGIVAKHGGRIDVESAPGKGSTFVVRLPIAQGRQ